MDVGDDVHANFYCRVNVALIFCCKMAPVPLASLANQPIFLFN